MYDNVLIFVLFLSENYMYAMEALLMSNYNIKFKRQPPPTAKLWGHPFLEEQYIYLIERERTSLRSLLYIVTN